MAKPRVDQPLVPSVLDRLLDEFAGIIEPAATREPVKSRGQLLRELKQSVARDLQNLLNTRCRCRSWAPSSGEGDLGELQRSLVNYGIPDVTGADLGTLGRSETFVRIIEEVIRRLEPRFRTVKVKVLDNVEPLDRRLRFRIDALLAVEPVPEPVVFDSVIQPATGNVEVISPLLGNHGR